MADKRKLPIDIQYKQLLEALVDRRIVPNKWLEQHKQIRDAIATLYPELPLASEKLTKFRTKNPSHEDLSYFDCKYIYECLTQSDEGASKNFFGQYTSPVLKRWGALIRQYEKNNVFAAETARIIAQNTAFEIPFLKKSIQQNEKQVADNNRKMADLNKSIAEYKRKLETSCADMGIVELCDASDEVMEISTTLDFEAEAAEISWDISLEKSATTEGGDIDWGIETVASTQLTAESADTPVEIDWDITTSDVVEAVDDSNSAEASNIQVTAADESINTVSATRVDLLDDNDFRTRVLNDLLELRAFLRQRFEELSASDSVAFANQFQGSSPLLEQQSIDKIEEFQTAVDQAVSLLTHKRLQQLVLIKTSERYLDRHVASLEMLTKHMDKSSREIRVLEDKNIDLIDATSNVQPQINMLVGKTKSLKKELENVLPALFKGYKVNIVGEVNSL
ncbi:hypothetical protein BBO99_00003892 [Phytophthora kernoviae]|uniref:CDK5 regulatory subunit-associated protein 3 n=2 Tax=Phytophthora kernoviae TaxID=325452 RepID=A0A3R7K0F2_9STRA|nr:hypothetical protein G195_006492 [Phytophthora kernoviae 00238/432]KAG2522952.1 hypothetical protein JM16_004574 [Phytophthora kernoviae]KAG2524591.1 hypothetical protein JM18_004100 [Phytophthora kernoviae]RLN25730.1 hypothetical protein BBI17_003911 [Phytophthora kernoviae]RLN81221.1 hypothetical protein BBO99_00003892 [Phytophthora kernoviae]